MAGVTELPSVGKDFTSILSGLGDGDVVSIKNSGRVGSNTDSVTTESDCIPNVAGTSAKVTEGWGEMNRGATSFTAGRSFSKMTSVMPSMRDPWSSVRLLSETASLWVLVKTVTEVGRVTCFVTLRNNKHWHTEIQYIKIAYIS